MIRQHFQGYRCKSGILLFAWRVTCKIMLTAGVIKDIYNRTLLTLLTSGFHLKKCCFLSNIA